MTIAESFRRHLGGDWRYCGTGSATWRDDRGRSISRVAMMGGWDGDDVVGTQWYLYGDGPTRHAEQYLPVIDLTKTKNHDTNVHVAAQTRDP